MATYGYARCSTNETRQDIDRQRRELKEMGVADDEHIYWEYASGMKSDRPEFNKLLGILKQGDVICVTEVSRLTRSTKHLCEILQTVQEDKVKLQIGKSFVVDCTKDDIDDAMTKGMIMMWGVFAEMERNIISQRVKSGMRNAKAKGKKIGRPSLKEDDIPKSFWKYYAFYKRGDMSVTEMAKLMSCSRTTIYAYIELASKKKA